MAYEVFKKVTVCFTCDGCRSSDYKPCATLTSTEIKVLEFYFLNDDILLPEIQRNPNIFTIPKDY